MLITRCLIVLMLLPVAATACANAEASSRTTARLSPAPDAVREAPAEIEVDGTALRVEADAWQHVPSDTSGGGLRCARLCAELQVIAAGGELPEIEVLEVLAVRADGMAAFELLDTDASDGRLVIHVERGPATEQGTILSLVVRLRTPAGRELLLHAYSVPVR